MKPVGLETTLLTGRISVDGYVKLFEQDAGVTSLSPRDNTLHLYAKDKAGVSGLFFRDDANVEFDLGAVSGAALTSVNDTNVTLTLGGTPATALLKAASLTLGWTGELAVTRGGTGQATVADYNALLDHGVLLGLADDDHTNYALLAGRSGGQALIGGTASGDDLTLQSTSNATRGDLITDVADITMVAASRARMASQNRFRYLNSMVRVRLGANDTGHAVGAFYTIPFDTEDYDTDGLHEGVTNPSRLTAALTGKYLITGTALIDTTNSTTPTRIVIRCIIDGSTTVLYSNATLPPVTSPTSTSVTVAFQVSLAATQYVELQAAVNAASGTFDILATSQITSLQMQYIGE